MELARVIVLAIVWLCPSFLAIAGDVDRRIDVWCDVDTATGISDVDDGLMLIQVFHSPELRVAGVSVVFGNAKLEQALPIARDIVRSFGPAQLEVSAGAASAEELGRESDAVRAMAESLRKTRLTILAVGPVTNIGTLVRLHPELHDRIERIVMVAARRPGQQFRTSKQQRLPHRDFNFELDAKAMQAILDTNIPLTFAPWEVSSHVWISRADLSALGKTGGSGAWIDRTSQKWIGLWEREISPNGFNPFDTLAAGWITHPQLIQSMPVRVWIEKAADDRANPEDHRQANLKPYLLVEPSKGEKRDVIYCFLPRPEFKEVLTKRLSGPEQPH